MGGLVDVEEDDAGAGEAAEGPAQQRQRLLRRPPDGDVEQRVSVISAEPRVERAAAVEKLACSGARRRRRAQDLHSGLMIWSLDGSAPSPPPPQS